MTTVHAFDEFTSLKNKNQKKILPKDLTVFTTLIAGGTVADDNQTGSEKIVRLVLRPTYLLSKGFSLSAIASAGQELTTEQAGFGNTDLLLNLPTFSLGDTSVSLSVAGTLPTNRDLYRDATYRGGVYLQSLMAAKYFDNTFPISVSYLVLGGQNFHEFRRNNILLPNTEYYVSGAVLINKNISKFTIGVGGVFTPRWDYFGTYEPLVSISQRIIYRSGGFLYALSHSNRGAVFNYRGNLDNVRVFDDYNSRVNFSVSYNIQ